MFLEFLADRSYIQDTFAMFGQYVLGPMLFGLISWFLINKSKNAEKNKYRHLLHISSRKNAEIQEKLTELRVKSGSDRCYLAMFHNGEKYVNGSEILKKSITNESVGESISYKGSGSQNIPISLLNEEMDLIENPGTSFIYIKDVKYGNFRRSCERLGIKTIVRYAVSSNLGIIGFIGLDYLDEVQKLPNLEELCYKYSSTIEQIISSYGV